MNLQIESNYVYLRDRIYDINIKPLIFVFFEFNVRVRV